MEQLPFTHMDTPATYRICVEGTLENDYAQRLWGMATTPIEKPGQMAQTALVGKVADQAVLVGIINALYNAGHTVVSVERLSDETNSRADKALPPNSVKEA